ncbi:uncharacterized protein FPRO_10559 [Fusarium proliferatum ET1]|uniref:Secreted protein n=1 Tax=Fusarium proliferatum (strain ET1) TaxID=1227346 RepID=A0A1L7VMQ1_FUSPR|nr:uncharacterized protein FPRO_10559 [Fusarium proliferatum ET1]CZR40970.1 uncharacterized protein FPRO_10559 [Fusarium proliferatum ET1]
MSVFSTLSLAVRFLLAMSQTTQNATFKSRLISFFHRGCRWARPGLLGWPVSHPSRLTSHPPEPLPIPPPREEKRDNTHLIHGSLTWSLPPKSASRRTSTPSK